MILACLHVIYVLKRLVLPSKMSIRIRFNASLKTRSQKGEFPADTISTVYVTNRDDCTYCEVPVNNKGELSADFEMKPTTEGVKLTDRVKFHFFFRDNKDNLLKPVCAGHMALVDLADKTKDGGYFEVGSNFNSNTVKMSFKANDEHSRSMHLDLLKLYQTSAITKSVLCESEKHLETMKRLDEHIKGGLDTHTAITSENGGHMFQSIFTAHMMENEATMYSQYHIDFDQPENVPPWQCTYLLAETLSHNAVTIDDVRAMDLRGLTDFIASYAQAPMRSASVVPYTLDLTLNEDPRAYAQNRTMLSEIFKRPYSHPNQILQGKATLMADDCEGLAALLLNNTNHLGYLYNNFSGDFKQTDTYMRYNNLMKRYFPKDLFCNMGAQYQNKLMELAIFLGEHVHKKVIECKITLVTANAASMGGEGQQHQLQAHATACMVCNHPNMHHVVVMEGTACMVDDQNSKRLKLGAEYVSLSDIANSLTMSAPFNMFTKSALKTKMAVHLTHSRGSFYRTAFCQNDALIGSQIGGQKLTYGVDMEYLADEKIKVYMPVTGKHLNEGELESLKAYVQARRPEIHLPLVDHDELRAGLRWAPIVPFKGCKELQAGRPFTTCMVHVQADEYNPTESLLQRVTAEVDEFNSDPKNSKLGVMRAFASMDGVSKVFHMYTDDTTELVKRLSVHSC